MCRSPSHDDGPGGVPAPPGERGREPPFFFFFLDLLPRWEKGFPSGPWSPWIGRGESPSEIGSVSLSLFVSALLILPFHRYFYNRRSVTLIGLNFGHDLYPDISFLAAKEGHQPPYGVATRVRGAPPASWPPPASSRVDFSSQKSHIFQKKSSSVFIPFGLRLIWIFCETKNMQQTGTGTGHWINMLVPKIL